MLNSPSSILASIPKQYIQQTLQAKKQKLKLYCSYDNYMILRALRKVCNVLYHINSTMESECHNYL